MLSKPYITYEIVEPYVRRWFQIKLAREKNGSKWSKFLQIKRLKDKVSLAKAHLLVSLRASPKGPLARHSAPKWSTLWIAKYTLDFVSNSKIYFYH